MASRSRFCMSPAVAGSSTSDKSERNQPVMACTYCFCVSARASSKCSFRCTRSNAGSDRTANATWDGTNVAGTKSVIATNKLIGQADN